MKNFKQLSKNLDIFGKNYSLNFDKSWGSHKTNYGLSSTLILAMFIAIYTVICFIIMIEQGQD